MSSHPFAGFNPKPSPWGYNWAADQAPKASWEPTNAPTQVPNHCPPRSSSPDPELMAHQLANMPAALINSLKREKKPFSYTPGGVNLNEVLNARLQKRLERKKKFYEDRAEENLPRFDPPKQVIVMPTHNSPLDMYSMENALEALEVQASLVANDKSFSAPSRSATLPRNQTFRFEERVAVPQSKAFKVLQIITDTDEDSSSGRERDQHRDEMRFTGLRDSKAIPSKFFHTLQKITGTDNDNEEDQQQHDQLHRSAAVQSTMPQKRTVPLERPFPQQDNHFQQANAIPQSFAQEQNSNMSYLKRPAAFLPIKTTPTTTSGFRPVQPSFLANGSIKRSPYQSAVSDF